MINPNAADLNFVIVNGMQSPGRARLSGLAVNHRWDVQKGHGIEGGPVVYSGRENAEFTL